MPDLDLVLAPNVNYGNISEPLIMRFTKTMTRFLGALIPIDYVLLVYYVYVVQQKIIGQNRKRRLG